MRNFLADAQTLVARMQTLIPLTAAMQLAVREFDGEKLVLTVPLSPNINDKGTAFAGSISALGNVTGWCLLTLWSEQEFGQDTCRVAVFDARFSFRKPLRGDFTASVNLPPPEERHRLRESVEQKGRGKTALQISLSDEEGEAVVLEAQYAVWKEQSGT